MSTDENKKLEKAASILLREDKKKQKQKAAKQVKNLEAKAKTESPLSKNQKKKLKKLKSSLVQDKKPNLIYTPVNGKIK